MTDRELEDLLAKVARVFVEERTKLPYMRWLYWQGRKQAVTSLLVCRMKGSKSFRAYCEEGSTISAGSLVDQIVSELLREMSNGEVANSLLASMVGKGDSLCSQARREKAMPRLLPFFG